MQSPPSRLANLGLYRQLMRAATGFSNYNFRNYAVRLVREDFRAAAALEGDEVRRHPERRTRSALHPRTRC